MRPIVNNSLSGAWPRGVTRYSASFMTHASTGRPVFSLTATAARAAALGRPGYAPLVGGRRRQSDDAERGGDPRVAVASVHGVGEQYDLSPYTESN